MVLAAAERLPPPPAGDTMRESPPYPTMSLYGHLTREAPQLGENGLVRSALAELGTRAQTAIRQLSELDPAKRRRTATDGTP